ncbi:MAG: VanZ family protein [bacterium]
MSGFHKYYLPAILWALVIFFFSSLPSSAVKSLSPQLDDLVLHFIEFSIFGFLLTRAIIQNPHRISWKLCIVVALIGIVYAASDETHQLFVQGRFATVSDFLADSIGVIFGMSIFIYVQKTF